MRDTIVGAGLALACAAVTTFLLASCTTVPPAETRTAAREVADTERAFAKTMADRDLAAFSNFIASDAVFFSGPKPLRGKQAVVEFWKRFYDKPEAPFSWRPESVEVLDSGTLALSSGPVFNAAGKQIATFNSIWRLEAPGTWRIVFDKGNSVCDCAKSP